MEFVPDCKKAQKLIVLDYFCEYSDAYVITNENLRNSMKYMPTPCESALAVAASGDQGFMGQNMLIFSI